MTDVKKIVATETVDTNHKIFSICVPATIRLYREKAIKGKLVRENMAIFSKFFLTDFIPCSITLKNFLFDL